MREISMRSSVLCLLRLKLPLVIVLMASLWSTTFANQQTLTPVDKNLPDFSLPGLDGNVYDTQSLKGKTWLINFWAVWCAPCLEELPSLNNAWAQLEGQGVGMLAINIGGDEDNIEQFLAENDLRIDFPIVVGDPLRSLKNWSVARLPHTVIVNPDGKIAYEAEGDREWDDPRFIDAIVALNQLPKVSTFSDKVSAAINQFHNMGAVAKIAIVLAMIFSVIMLMFFVRMLHRRKITSV